MKKILFVLFISFLGFKSFGQAPDEKQLGAWYMYFWNTTFKKSNWGLQGDYQYRDWIGLGDREQLLVRTGLTFTPTASNIKFTLGYGNITTGKYGSNLDAPIVENRIYQEALFGQKLLQKLLVKHRFRYEQRFVENQNFRTRYRYHLLINIPLKGNALNSNTTYFSFYNELFINGERSIGNEKKVQFFDRNRTYFGFGYVLQKNIRFQLGWMQQTVVNWQKNQLQVSVHHTF